MTTHFERDFRHEHWTTNSNGTNFSEERPSWVARSRPVLFPRAIPSQPVRRGGSEELFPPLGPQGRSGSPGLPGPSSDMPRVPTDSRPESISIPVAGAARRIDVVPEPVA